MRSLLISTVSLLFPSLLVAGPVISTASGRLHGVTNATTAITSFLNVPYALPPVNSRRFLPPEPLPRSFRYRDLDATSFGPACYQFLAVVGNITFDPTKQPESEDCLSLNIFLHSGQLGTKKKPVLVFIHGGGFAFGSGREPTYDPTGFVRNEKDVIFVTLNYRLGILGYPSSPALKKDQRNAGLKDMLLALSWVRENIAAFGGDAKRVMMFGESAGSVAVDTFLYAFPREPVAASAIMQSGNVELYSLIGNSSEEWNAAAGKAGCADTANRNKELECMRRKDANALRKELISAGKTGGIPEEDGDLVFSLSEYAKRGKEGRFARVPTIIGTTDHEGDIFGYIRVVNGTLDYSLSDQFTKETFTCPSSRAVREHVKAGLPTWRYRWMAAFPSTRLDPTFRATHGSELPYVLGSYAQIAKTEPSESEEIAAKWMHKAWAALARDPQRGLERIGWPRYDANAKTLAELFDDEQPRVKYALGNKYDGGCPGES